MKNTNILRKHVIYDPQKDVVDTNKLKLAPPWNTYFSQIKALFDRDPEIHITEKNDAGSNPEIVLRIDSQQKYEALSKLLPETKTFGNVVANITLIPANDETGTDMGSVFADAFKDNPVLKDVVSLEAFGSKLSYVVFQKEVVQFYNDEMQDPNGLKSTLYQDIAKEIFESREGIFFCTSDK